MSSIKHLEKLEKIANLLLDNKNVEQLSKYYDCPAFQLCYYGDVVPKERPRSARGHTYTPKKTRDFEAKVKDLAKKKMAEMKQYRFYRYCIVHLTIFDKMPENWPWWMEKLAQSGMIFQTTGGDLDNKEKAVLDAFNKVVYDDDRQIVQLYKYRVYSEISGFKVTIEQIGLSKEDLETIRRYIERVDGKAAARR